MFTGHVEEIPVGLGGLTGTRNMALVRPDQLVLAENISFADGSIRKEGGAEKYNSSAISGTPKILGGYDWWPDDSKQRMVVVTDDGKILKDSGDGTFPTTLKTGLTTTGMVGRFIEGGEETLGNNAKLFVFTGVNQVQVLNGDGATTADISTPPADWSSSYPNGGAYHENRVWGWVGHRIYYSTTDDHEDFTGSGSGQIAVYPGTGTQILFAISLNTYLIVFKDKGVFYIDTTASDITTWRSQPINRNISIAGPDAGTEIDGDFIFMDPGGNLHALSTVQEAGNLGSRSFMDEADIGTLIRDNMNKAELANVIAHYYVAKRELSFSMSGIGTTNRNRRLVIDFNRSPQRAYVSTKDEIESIWNRKDSDEIDRPTVGDTAGFIWDLDQETRSRDGEGYEGVFQSAHLDFSWVQEGLGAVEKNFKFLEMVVEPVGNWDLNVDIIIDGDTTQTVTFNMGVSGSALGSFTLGTDKLGGDQVLNRRQRIVGSGRRVSLKGRNSGAGQDFSVARFYIGFKPGRGQAA